MPSILPMLFLAAALAGHAGKAAPVAEPAGEAVYRCQSPEGAVSIQSAPCPKGDVQRKVPFDRPPPSAPAAVSAPAAAPPAPPPPLVAGHPVTPPAAMHGPGDPYPLWECMRADGSTYESRDGLAGRQWVASTDAEAAPPAPALPTDPKQLAEYIRKGGRLSHPIESTDTADMSNARPSDAPPAGAPPGKWVRDECTQLDPGKACERYAARRDALRREIYAARPSDRAQFAPEEQDLTSMLYAACGR